MAKPGQEVIIVQNGRFVFYSICVLPLPKVGYFKQYNFFVNHVVVVVVHILIHFFGYI